MIEPNRQSRLSDMHAVALAVEEVHGDRAEAAIAARIRRCTERGDTDAASQWQGVRRILQQRRRVRFS
jgi:hypothetical protein